jgi:predicted GNAT family acetyltransferase
MEFPQAGSGPNRKQIIDALRNTAQSASNMVAENVSMPMDAIAWALRKAGVPVEKPMFGSDWMKEKGVTPTVPEGAAKVVGDTIGMISPMGLTKQGAKAMVDGVSKLKGLPVGMSIKDVGEISAKYPDVKLDVFDNKNNINLNRIVVPKEMRGQGIGSQVMQDIVQYADDVKKPVTLTPSSDFGGNVNRLKDFYKQFGFVENKGKNKDFSTMDSMYRNPKE